MPRRKSSGLFFFSYLYNNFNHIVSIVKVCCGRFYRNGTYQVFVFLQFLLKFFPETHRES